MLLSQKSLVGVPMVLVGRMVAAVGFPIKYGLFAFIYSLPPSSVLRADKNVGFSVTFPSYQMAQLLPLGIFILCCSPSSPYYYTFIGPVLCIRYCV